MNKKELLYKLTTIKPFDVNNSINLIDKYIEYNPLDTEVLLMKAHLYDSIYEFDMSFDIYKQILDIDSSNIQVLIDLGDHYFNCNDDYLTALSYYERALNELSEKSFYDSKQDEFVSACIGKANALIELDRIGDALDTVESGIQAYPQDIVLLSVLQKIRLRRRGQPST